jgi:tetratricopeptide (TPR) repeat protein
MFESRAIFISSTFSDMQAERDYLRTRVFPELEERLNARKKYLEWVDLRVGVATTSLQTEQIRELHVLKVCLDEVKRCEPFLIVLLGDRYGWIPPEDRLKAAMLEAVGTFSPEMAGRSVTDLEIDQGILSNKSQQTRSFFYFRAPLPYEEMSPEVAALYSDAYSPEPASQQKPEKIQRLKSLIERRLPDRVRHYSASWSQEVERVSGLEALGRMVLEDIWSELLSETVEEENDDQDFFKWQEWTRGESSWQRVEKDSLKEFADDLARDFVGREELVKATIRDAMYSESDLWATLVVGAAGSGKSALFGKLFQRLQYESCFLLAHSAAGSSASPSVDVMLRRWIRELADSMGTFPPDSTDYATIDFTFTRLLREKCRRGRVVMLIDALDQFEDTPRARYLGWLPSDLPEDAHLIVTSKLGSTEQALARRKGVTTIEMPDLKEHEARSIIECICRRYHRTFEPNVVNALLEKRSSTNFAWVSPLWLVLSVEELNLLDEEDFALVQKVYSGKPAERIRAMMLDRIQEFSADIGGMCVGIFEKADKVFGATIARAFLALIAIGRSGWRESDLRIMLPAASGQPWDELVFAQLRRLFRGQIRRRGALDLWDFDHAQMRVAARARLQMANWSEKQIHGLVASRLLSCPPDDLLRSTETMFHLLKAEDWTRATLYYGDQSLNETAVEAATLTIVSAITETDGWLNGPFADWLDSIETHSPATAGSRFLSELVPALRSKTTIDITWLVVDYLKSAFGRLTGCGESSGPWVRQLALAHAAMGQIQREKGDISGALASFDVAFATARQETSVVDQRDRLTGHLLSNIGELQWARGQQLAARKSLQDAVKHAEAALRISPKDRNNLAELAAIYLVSGEFHADELFLEEAVASFERALGIMSSLVAEYPDNFGFQRGLAWTHVQMAAFFLKKGDLRRADTFVSSGRNILTKLLARDPENPILRKDLATSCCLVAALADRNRDYELAMQWYEHCRTIREELCSRDPDNSDRQLELAGVLARIGDADASRSRFKNAIEHYGQSRKIWESLVILAPDNARWKGCLADILGKLATSHWRANEPSLGRSLALESKIILEDLVRSCPDSRNVCNALSNATELLSSFDRPTLLNRLRSKFLQ